VQAASKSFAQEISRLGAGERKRTAICVIRKAEQARLIANYLQCCKLVTIQAAGKSREPSFCSHHATEPVAFSVFAYFCCSSATDQNYRALVTEICCRSPPQLIFEYVV